MKRVKEEEMGEQTERWLGVLETKRVGGGRVCKRQRCTVALNFPLCCGALWVGRSQDKGGVFFYFYF